MWTTGVYGKRELARDEEDPHPRARAGPSDPSPAARPSDPRGALPILSRESEGSNPERLRAHRPELESEGPDLLRADLAVTAHDDDADEVADMQRSVDEHHGRWRLDHDESLAAPSHAGSACVTTASAGSLPCAVASVRPEISAAIRRRVRCARRRRRTASVCDERCRRGQAVRRRVRNLSGPGQVTVTRLTLVGPVDATTQTAVRERDDLPGAEPLQGTSFAIRRLRGIRTSTGGGSHAPTCRASRCAGETVREQDDDADDQSASDTDHPDEFGGDR